MAGLYIDHGWNMGWCTLRRGQAIASGSVDFRAHNRTDGMRLLSMTQWLTALLGQLDAAGEKLGEIVYEQVTFVGKNDADTVHAHGKQLGNLQRWAALKKQPDPRGIEVGVIKKHVTGHRSAKRDTVLDEMRKRFAPTMAITDADQASAVAVMLTANPHFRPAA